MLPFNPIDWCDDNLFNQQTCHWGARLVTDQQGKQSAYFYYHSPNLRLRLRNDMFGELLKMGEDPKLIGIKKGDALINLQGVMIAQLPSATAQEIADGVLIKIINKK